ncbi:MAG: glycosyltransferase family 1 protein [Sphingomonadaceae bacterium]|jgi:glycosyltransferase involved in cell wall biosynthesis
MTDQTLRVALFSGNYNYVKDGANQALNKLVGYLLGQGVSVRVYSPTTDTPAFEPAGDLVSAPSWPIPRRPEYQIPLGLTRALRRDLRAFAPNLIHVSSPDPLGHGALKYGRKHGLPVVASVHTRFETYPRYYGLAFLEPLVEAMLRRFYRRCDAIMAPSEALAQMLREQRMSYDVGVWTRGIDESLFNPAQRDLTWRKSIGLSDDVPVIGYIGRLVMEKGLDVFADTIDELQRRQIRHQVMVIGDGPARAWFEHRMPDAKFIGFQIGSDLGRAVASMDMLFNPSVTEAFGNVTLETMACGLPVVAAQATGSDSIVKPGVSGQLIRPGAIGQFADALAAYCQDEALRAEHGGAGLNLSGRYRWDTINQSMLDTYRRVSAQRLRGAMPQRSPVP